VGDLIDLDNDSPIDRANLLDRIGRLSRHLDRFPSDSDFVAHGLLPLVLRYQRGSDPELAGIVAALWARRPSAR